MIRPAEQIITSHNITRNDPESDFDWLVNLIKEVQTEAIKECIEVAQENHKADCPMFTVPQLKKLLDQMK